MIWHLFDNGGNWCLFLLAFCAIEGTALRYHHRTLSETFWTGMQGNLGGWLLPLAWIALSLVLFAHLIGYWPGRG